MIKPDATSDLDQLILEQEQKHRDEGLLLKQEFRTTVENLQPASIITSTLKELSLQPGIGNQITQALTGMAAGFIVKKIQQMPADNPFGQLLKTFVGSILPVMNSASIKKENS